MSEEYQKAVDTLMKDVSDLRADMKEVISVIKAKAGGFVDEAKDCLHESAAHRLDQARDAADAFGKQCRKGLKSCAGKIEDRPFVSVLTALGVGVVLGGLLIWHRR
jgi:ElaB/YqjD/DUF883 family membrane-anchored ribosome-binding protein